MRLNEPIQLNESVEAVVTFLHDEDDVTTASDEDVRTATAKILEQHDELFRRLAK